MAQKIQTLFIDDIDGGEADGTVRFGLDGAEYEIDLSAAHDAELRAALGNYISHARKVTARGARPAGRAGGRRPGPVDTTAVRAWARDNGIDIKDRGRVPADVVAKYQAAAGVLATRQSSRGPVTEPGLWSLGGTPAITASNPASRPSPTRWPITGVGRVREAGTLGVQKISGL